MTSTPEDGEIEELDTAPDVRELESYGKHADNLTQSVTPSGQSLQPDEDVLQFDQEDLVEEVRRAESVDEADTIPDDAEVIQAAQASNGRPQSPSVDSSLSIPDDDPSFQNSALSSPRSDALSSQPSLAQNRATPPRRPFDLRFQSRLSSSTLLSPRARSPAFLHSRQSSLASFGAPSVSEPDDSAAPWEVIRWTRLGKLTNQAFSEIGRRNFGSPTCLAVTDNIVIGTSRGTVLVFDHQQNLKAILGQATKAAECGSVIALAISADHSTVAAGHATGHIFTWEIIKPSRPFLHIPPVDVGQPEARRGDGHVEGSCVLHVGFLGFRRTALVSADDHGMAFSHLASRGTGSLGRTVKTTRVLGRYPDLVSRPSKSTKPTKKSSVLAFSPLPLGNVEQQTDSMGLVAMLTPYLLVIVSTTPIAQTQHKAARPKEVSAHSAMTAALAWFPAIKLKGSDTAVSHTKLVYAWTDVLTILEIHEVATEDEDEKAKPPELQFLPRSRFKSEEAIVAVQWLSRSVIAVLTITQQLLIIEDSSMTVTDSFDLLSKDIYHIDSYSQQLQAVIETFDEGDTSLHGVVADAFHMSFRAYKGRLFLLGFKSMWWGALTNWADRLLAMMDAGDFIGAIRLATNYYIGVGEKLTIGLPDDPEQRAGLVREKLLEMMSASLKYAFGKNQKAATGRLNETQLADLAVACVAACLSIDEKDFMFDEVFAWYDDHGEGSIFVDVLEPHILDGKVDSLPPPVIQTLISHFKVTRSLSKLEETICLLDPTSMDLDQVTKLCKSNNLYDAYIYVWNTALQDYVGPLQDLLQITMEPHQVNGHAVSNNAAAEIPHKMFAYLSFILTGRAYPTGLFLDEAIANEAKFQLYEYLFSGSNHDALREADSTTSYPSLRRILSYDTPSFMSALNEAFEDNYLNDDEMLNGSSDTHVQIKVYTRQFIVNILLLVMSSGFDAKESIYLDMFIGRNLPKYPQYMLLSGSDLQDIFMRLCHYEDDDLRDDAQLSVEYLLTAYQPLEILKFVPVLRRARFYRVLKSIFKQERQFADLVGAFLLDPDDKLGVFEVIEHCIRKGSSLDDEEKTKVKEVVQNHASELLDIDVSQCAITIGAVLPDLHETFVHTLDDDNHRQFQYLRTLIEPSQTVALTNYVLEGSMLELYVRLMCQYDPGHVVEYIRAVRESDLRLDHVMPALESSGIVDAAVVLMTRQGLTKEAMNRLVKHIGVLGTALKGILQSSQEAPDQAVTDEAIEDLLESIDRYTGVGVWICQSQKLKSVAKSPRIPVAQQPLSFEETLWLDLIVSIVATTQDITPESLINVGSSEKVQATLRNAVQRVFTALLSMTTSSREGSRSGSDFAFLRILRSFLTRAAEMSPTLSELRSVISSIFSAYTYEESLLALSNSMLDKDVFVYVDEVAKLRQRGWRPRGQVCEICRRRVWGPGTGLKIWEAWEECEEQRKARRRMQHELVDAVDVVDGPTGKGKAAVQSTSASAVVEQQQSSSSDTKNDVGPITVFSCRHIYHQACLIQNASPPGQEGLGRQQHPLDGVHLTCPSCP